MAGLPMTQLPRISLHSPSVEDVSQMRPTTPTYARSLHDVILDPVATPPEYIPIAYPPTAIRRSGSTSRRSVVSDIRLDPHYVDLEAQPFRREDSARMIREVNRIWWHGHSWSRKCIALSMGGIIVACLSIVWLGLYIRCKHQRPDNWGDTNTDFQLPLLILLLLVVWLAVTATLVAFYWPSNNWALGSTMEHWQSTGASKILAPCIAGLWLIGLVLCGAPPIVTICLAIFA